MDFLVANCQILIDTPQGPQFDFGWILTKNGVVRELGKGEFTSDSKFEQDVATGKIEIVDGRGGILIPPLINAHTHLGQSFSRICYSPPGLANWLAMMRPIRDKIGYHELFCASSLSIAENLALGTGTLVEHFKYSKTTKGMEAVLKSIENAGIQAYIVAGYRDQSLGTNTNSYSPTEAIRDIKQLSNSTSNFRKIRWGIGPTGLPQCSPETVIEGASLAAEHELIFHFHVSETLEEIDLWKRKTGLSPIKWLMKNRLLNPYIHLVHCAHVDSEEVNAIAKSRALVVICPISELLIGTGFPPLDRYLEAGVRVAVASDGQGSNWGQGVLEGLRIALLTMNRYSYNPNCSELISLVYPNIWDYREIIGFHVGCSADMVLFDTSRIEATPLIDPFTTLLFSVPSMRPKLLIVDDKVLVRDEKLLTIDEEALILECNDIAKSLHIPSIERKLKMDITEQSDNIIKYKRIKYNGKQVMLMNEHVN